MAFAGEREVQRACQPDAYGPAGFPGAQCRDGRPRIGLHFLASEGAPHAQTFHCHFVARESQHPRDHFLSFGGMLGGRMRRHAAGFIQPRNRALRFQIKMLLAADLQFAFETQGARFDHRRIAASQPQRSGVKTSGLDRIFDGQDCGERFVFSRDARCAPLRRLQGFAQNPRYRLAVIHHFAREKRFIVTIRTRVALAWNVARGKNGDDARFQ